MIYSLYFILLYYLFFNKGRNFIRSCKLKDYDGKSIACMAILACEKILLTHSKFYSNFYFIRFCSYYFKLMM